MAATNKLTHDIVIYAELRNTSPLIMGAQKEDDTDLEILKHSNGAPYISGTAFGGKLLRYFAEFDFGKYHEKLRDFKEDVVRQNLAYLLGNEENSQSHILISNLELVDQDDYVIALNDSNKISKATGVTANKFNFEKLEPGCRFAFKAHFKIRSGFDLIFFKDAVLFIQQVLATDFSVGAKTRNGYGRIELERFRYKLFDYTKAEAFEEWEKYLKSGDFKDEFANLEAIYFKYSSPKKIAFNLNLAIKSQFITGEMVMDTNDVDKKQSQRQNGDFILKGEAAKNALSHRAYRILNSVSNRNEVWVNQLMLYVFGEDLSGNEKHKPAHLKVNESDFKNVVAEKQTRIKISRFTGGTVKGALAESMPIHSTDKTRPNITLAFELNEEPENSNFSNAVTLMLMLIKDLFTEDLPIGGEKATGKGIMSGCESSIEINQTTIQIDKNGIDNENAHLIQPFNSFNLPEYASRTY